MYANDVIVNGTRVRYYCTGCDHRVERIYIAPFVKGPDDKPFSPSKKINILSR